ncbi:cleft lip and palate transmembrane protein 1-domain-containing protein [Naematelia encephala]|uniref:Cleft lip and palate transmembrane protein 1-domain-containing protein n=1 Tax=Naematelia encephala TaxID=71784 RepID=A0A1Y2AU53_9TREE|nr:cleft lip and palate transmembrane protein 1-domain-containing protein [Naematelia encephala]
MAQPRTAAPAARQGGPAPAAQDDGGWAGKLPAIARSVAMFLAFQMAMKYGMQYLGMGSTKPSPQVPASTDGAISNGPVTPSQPGQILAQSLWPIGTPLSMLLYTSTSPDGEDIDHDKPLVVWDGLTYGEWKDEREADLELDVPESVRANNGTWWMDVVLVKGGGDSLSGKGPLEVAGYRKQLTRFLPKKRVRKEKKLIGGDEETEDEKEAEPVPVDLPAQPIVAHWSSNLTLTIVHPSGPIDFATLQPPVASYHQLAPTGPEEPKAYFPVLFPNDFWLMRENLLPINDTSYSLPLHVNYHALSSMKFQLYSAMTQSFEQAAQQQGNGAEMDEIKRMLTETSPWLLVTTALVTLLHTLFEFLAFSSDIGHWRKKDKDLVGVSLNTILTNCFVQLVILLYLHDSSEETSFMILFGQGIGLLIEAWKITKSKLLRRSKCPAVTLISAVADVRIREAPGTLLGYRLAFEDKKVLSEEEKQTQEYDRQAFQIVSYFAAPVLLAYTGYSLLYETHRGWYSFIITTLAQAIYMFGFVQLVPQLIINYKLKSVAHIPMKAMMYKTLSTVVDDFFAFCIRMPWLHRLACFRDDVVFLVLLYQRWIYRVDYSRVNEYGQVQEGMVEPVGDKQLADKIESKKDK